jgi:RNA polymerase sigma factor (sigma-70 family)
MSVKPTSVLSSPDFACPPGEATVLSAPSAMPEKPANRRDFGTLYRATLAPLQRYLRRLLGNSSEAEEVAHDAYARVYPLTKRQSAEHPEALLYLTARRLAINRLKRRSVSPFSREALDLDTTASTAPGVEHQVMARQEWHLLEQAIADLPEGCRAVLLLRKIELLSHREIAARLGIAVSTVEKQHARALRLLRAALPEESARGGIPPTSANDPETSS